MSPGEKTLAMLASQAPLPEDGASVVPVSYKVSHELRQGESDPKLADLVDRLSDARAQQIVDDVILPHFREGAMEQGIEAGVDAIAETLTGIAAPGRDRRVA